MKNIMLDLETMGTGSNAAIVSIGAVSFDPKTGEIGSEFYAPINLITSHKYGEIDASTVLWWLGQSEEARAEISCGNSYTLESALSAFGLWLDSVCERRTRIVWGNGATFDNVILRNTCIKAGVGMLWDFFNDRDVRTIVDLGRSILNIDPKNTIPKEGTAHNALDDARHQAKYVSEIYMHLDGII